MQVNEHYWVIVMEPNEKNRSYHETQYWGSKRYCGRWVPDSQQEPLPERTNRIRRLGVSQAKALSATERNK